MARFVEPTAEQERLWAEWLASRPARVRTVADQFEPWSLYRMKSTGHRVTVCSFFEGDPVTLSVNVTGEFNAIAFERCVVGVDPSDLEPCELPDPDEALGAALTDQEVEENIDALRVAVRPDLWDVGPDGKARCKDN